MHYLIDVIGGDAGLGCGSCNIKNFARQATSLSHGLLALGIVDFELVATAECSVVLGVAVLPPDGMGNRLGDDPAVGKRIDGA
jgi:hypothetical protein